MLQVKNLCRSQQMYSNKLLEGLEHGDLARLIHPELHVDEFKSKLGDDQDVIVLSFKVDSKEPANDLVSFIEKVYEWVLDADVSSGEMDDGSYIVFVELDRTKQAADDIMELMKDLINLTDQSTDDWRVRYYKAHKEKQLSIESLTALIPSTPEEYEKKYAQDELDQLKTAAGVKVTTKAPKNDFTESIKIAAGNN